MQDKTPALKQRGEDNCSGILHNFKIFQLYLSHTVGVIEERKWSKQLTCHKPRMSLVEQERFTPPEHPRL